MAAVSPIVLNSSSPNSFRIPSVTPPSLQRRSIVPISSSPGLVSPSRFVKPRAPALKSGSRAQQLPDGAATGFASARSLWTLRRFDAGDEDVSKKRQKVAEVNNAVEIVEMAPRRSTGKLKKPSKTEKINEPEVAHEKTPETPELKDFRFQQSLNKEIEQVARPDAGTLRSEFPARRSPPIRSPSISLAEYAFEVPAEAAKNVSLLSRTKPSKTPRNKTGRTAELTGNVPVKKPRKRKKKSESIILNSDEPEVDHVVDTVPGQESDERNTATKALKRQHDSKEKVTKSTKRQPKVTGAGPIDTNASSKATLAIKRTDQDAGVAALATEQSAYFAKPAVREMQGFENAAAQPHHTSPEPNSDADVDVEGNAIIEAASRRRRSWTPAKDTTALDLSDSRPPTAQSEVAHASQAPKPQLRDILGNFGYFSNDLEQIPTLERFETGEAVTKRRRIELAAPVNDVTIVRDAPQSAAPALNKVSKRQKAPKKKAQTITALATAAFQPPTEADTENTVVSQFFAPRNDVAANPETPVEKPQTVLTKPKKARKPKAKANSEETHEGSAKPKKASKPKKAKVKFNRADYLPKLLSPVRANAQLERQDLLFGTSSQLAVDESATFIRDMQAAVRESEVASTLR